MARSSESKTKSWLEAVVGRAKKYRDVGGEGGPIRRGRNTCCISGKDISASKVPSGAKKRQSKSAVRVMGNLLRKGMKKKKRHGVAKGVKGEPRNHGVHSVSTAGREKCLRVSAGQSGQEP